MSLSFEVLTLNLDYLTQKMLFANETSHHVLIGVVRMMEKLYAGKKPLDQQELLEIGEKWQPYRTVATWYLWRDLDPEPVEY